MKFLLHTHLFVVGAFLAPTSIAAAHHTQLATQPPLSYSDSLTTKREQQLGTVEVTGKAVTTRYEGKHLVFTSAALKAAQGGNMAEALRQLPGVHIGAHGTLQLYGLSQLALYVDGRPLRLTTAEQTAYLQTLAVADVEKVEIIREPSPEFPEFKSPILNIIRKHGDGHGVKGYSQMGLSLQHLLSENLATRITLAHGKHQSYAFYNLSDKRNLETTDWATRHDTLQTDNRLAHTLGVGSFLQLSPHQSFQWQGIANFSQEHLYLDALRSNNLRNKNGYLSAFYQWKIPTSQWQLTAEGALSQQNTDRHRAQYLETNTTNGGFYALSSYLAHEFSPHFGLSVNVGYQYLQSDIDENSSLLTHLHEHRAQTALYLHLQNRTSYVEIGDFIYGEWRRMQFTPHPTTLSSSLQPQLSRRNIVQLPYFYARHDFSPQWRTEISYQSNYQLPNLRDLSPFTTQATTATYRNGNPELRTAFSHKLRFNVTYLRAAQLEVSYQRTRDALVDAIEHNEQGLLLKKHNLDRSEHLRLLLALPLPLVNNTSFSWTASTYFAQQWQWDKGEFSHLPYQAQQHSWYIQHRHTFALRKTWFADIGFTRYSTLIYGLFRMQPQWWWDASVSHVAGKWRIALNAHDLFNNNRARGTFTPNGQIIAFERQWHSPKIELSVSYSWGKSSVKRVQSRERNDNQQRLNFSNESLQVAH